MVGTSMTFEPHKPPPKAVMLTSLIADVLKALLRVVFHAGRMLFPLRWRPGTRAGGESCVFYEGSVVHVRAKPVGHRFDYAVKYCFMDLDCLPLPCFAALAADRLSASQARKMSGCQGKVKLLALPESAGYEQNPIVVYFCYDEEGHLRKCLAEVTNTPWADRVTFPFDPAGDDTPKPMHVSPLQDTNDQEWHLSATVPGETLKVSVRSLHEDMGGNFFAASLILRRLPHVSDPERWAWLMPHKVVIWIYWHAALLLWRGVPFLKHPKNVDGQMFKERTMERAMAAGRAAHPHSWSEELGKSFECCPYLWRDATSYPWNY